MSDIQIIGISGYAGSGKDTLANCFEQYGYKRIAFADKVKELAVRLNPELQKRIDNAEELEDIKRTDPDVRRWLQEVGVTAREVLGDDVWVRAALDGLGDGKYVISDVRFKNEAEMLRQRGACLIRINRPGVGPANNHISEVDLQDYRHWHRVINNDRDIASLRVAATIIATQLEPQLLVRSPATQLDPQLPACSLDPVEMPPEPSALEIGV